MNIIQIFSTPIWETQFPDFESHRDVFRSALDQYREQNPDGDPDKYIENGGYQSLGDITMIDAMAPLFEYICQITMKASFDLQFRPGNIFIPRSWLMIQQGPQVHVPEQTMADTFTGVFFLEAPANSGKLQLRNNGMNPLWHGRSMIERRNRFNSSNINIDPDPGMIFMWPSHVGHSVSVNHHEESLVSLFFTSLILPRDIKPMAEQPNEDPQAEPSESQVK